MRFLRVAAAVLLFGVVAAGLGAALVAAHRQSEFDAQASSLQRTWTHDVSVGVPGSSIQPLQSELRAQRPHNDWYSPVWLSTDGSALLGRLQSATSSAFTAALAGQKAKAEAALSAWQQEVTENQKFVPAAQLSAAQAWPAQLAAATTPDQVAALSSSWQTQLDTTRTEVLAAQQQAKIQADLAAVGGPSGLISEAQTALTRASSDDLDPGEVSSLLAQLKTEVASGAAVDPTSAQLYAALDQLQQLFTLNDQLNGEMRPLELLADQAAAEKTPNSSTLVSRYKALDQAYLSGTTYEQLDPLQSEVSGLNAAIQSELGANQCGHSVGSGKVITISISLQEMVMYDNGCVAKATPITTGRPAFPTPTGDFHVFYKTSPFEMISMYPKGSPGWYPDTWVQWVMEFAGGGYFIHDAYWESQSAFGPGSEYEVAQDYASHGCVHVPTALMPWLYSWTPYGTPVIITS